MDTTSSTPARTALVWDLPVRLFHWLSVGCFAGAWLTAESERWRLLHVGFGYTLAGLLAFRVLWGLVGTRHARFADFVRGPRAVVRYLRSLATGRPEHHVGHNPAGALAIVAMLVLIGVTAASGYATYNDIGPGWLEELHEGAASTLLAVVIVHVAGVVIGSLLHRENLVRAMVTGRKAGVPPAERIGRRGAIASGVVAAALLAGVLGFWGWQWQDAGGGLAARDGGGLLAGAGTRHHREDDDD